MIAIAAPGAPKQAKRCIGAYMGRWIGIAGPFILLAVLGALLWFLPLASTDPQRDKLWIGCSMLAFLVLWWAFIWLWPTLVYRKHRKAGDIMEIRDKATRRFLRDYYKAVEERTRRFNEAAGHRRQQLLLEVAGLDLNTASGQHQRDTLFAAELQKLEQPDPAFPSPPVA